jgi:hypothetical protein
MCEIKTGMIVRRDCNACWWVECPSRNEDTKISFTVLALHTYPESRRRWAQYGESSMYACPVTALIPALQYTIEGNELHLVSDPSKPL